MIGQWFRVYSDDYRLEERDMYQVVRRNLVDGNYLLVPEGGGRELRENLKGPRILAMAGLDIPSVPPIVSFFETWLPP